MEEPAPGNSNAIIAFHDHVTRHRLRALRRRSQRHNLRWYRMTLIATRYLPPVQRMRP